jgi:hypothetical protein
MFQAAVVVGPMAAIVAGVTGCVECAIAALFVAGARSPARSVAIGEKLSVSGAMIAGRTDGFAADRVVADPLTRGAEPGRALSDRRAPAVSSEMSAGLVDAVERLRGFVAVASGLGTARGPELLRGLSAGDEPVSAAVEPVAVASVLSAAATPGDAVSATLTPAATAPA